MEALFIKSARKINTVPLAFKRYLFDRFSTQSRMLIIKGARGAGKTTLLLQYAHERLPLGRKTLYVALDDLYFLENRLYDLADMFRKQGGQYLLLDEVHKYPGWSRELKLIYDDFPGLHIMATSSSLLELHKTESDLSRRAVWRLLKEMSLREFVYFRTGKLLPAYDLDDLIHRHEEIALELMNAFKPLEIYHDFIRLGAYPFFMEDRENYHDKLLQIVNLVLETDLPAVERVDFAFIVKLKKLLGMVAESVPFTPNITKLSERIGISRNALVRALYLLEKARLLLLLNKEGKGLSKLSKPDKIYLNNPNLSFALKARTPDTGTLRETFLANQVESLYPLHLHEKADFLVDGRYVLEVGGKNKGFEQIKNYPNAYIVRDDLENGTGKVIPLWLFGFLY